MMRHPSHFSVNVANDEELQQRVLLKTENLAKMIEEKVKEKGNELAAREQEFRTQFKAQEDDLKKESAGKGERKYRCSINQITLFIHTLKSSYS